MKPIETQKTPLSDFEINELAANIATSVVDQLNERWYDNSDISLSIVWSPVSGIDAYASASPTLEAPTRHTITFTYDFVSRIYSEALDFAIFAKGPEGQMHPSGAHLIPDHFGILEAAE
jgi:hypothetical protein